MKKYLFSSVLAIAISAVFTGCSKSTDLYDQGAIDAQNAAQQAANLEQAKIAYAQNFVKKYGDVDPNQSWDLTTGLQLGTRGPLDDFINYFKELYSQNKAIKVENVSGLDFGTVSEVTVNGKKAIQVTKNQSIFNAISSILPDGKRHEGMPVITLTAPSSDFYIYPVSVQGLWTHDLKVKVGDKNPVTVYSKGWTDYSVPYVNGYKGHYMGGVRIQAPVGTPIDIYVDNVKEGSNKKNSGGTYNGQAIYVDAGNATINPGFTLKQNAIIKYIGIEDNAGSNSDLDYNDVVLAIVGNPDVPGKVEELEYDVETSICKRYMVEDLGATDDYDFNDIVVDVYQNFTEHRKKTVLVSDSEEEGVVLSDVSVSTEAGDQTAIVRAMGGTLDFDITIGSTTWSKSGAKFDIRTMYNTQNGYNPNEELAKFTVEGWEPNANNITITVKSDPERSNMGTYDIPFPKAGEIPMILAVNATTDYNWMVERQDISKDWWERPGQVKPE